jgi:putative salt-induced outer membrane protein
MFQTRIRPVFLLMMIVGAVALVPCQARADWTGKGEAGVASASGNTETKNANAKLELANTIDQWKHAVGLAGIYAKNDDETTGQRWEVYEQSDYNFNPNTFWFGAGRYEQDRFSGFEYQAIASTGLGRHFIDNERTKFTGTAGVGYKFFSTRDTYDDTGTTLLQRGESDNEVVFRGSLALSHSLTDTTKLLDKLLVESGGQNTFVQNDIGIQVKMSDVLALAVAYSVRYNSDPPPGFVSTDRLTTLNLVYEIK